MIIEKLKAKKDILDNALRESFAELGESFFKSNSSGQTIEIRTKTTEIWENLKRVESAIAECESVEHVFYNTSVPAVVPIPIEPAPTKVEDSTDCDIPF